MIELPPYADLLNSLREELADVLPRTVVNTWFSDVEIQSFGQGRLVLQSPLPMKRDIIASRFLAELESAVRKITREDCAVQIVCASSSAPEAPPARARATDERPEFSFDRFVVGESNKFAAAAARAVAESPGVSYNPLFLYGGSGLGKTHLLYAIMNEVRQRCPGYMIRAFSAEQFTNELVLAIREKNMPDFREKYRKTDVLLVDDIQFVAGKDFSQEEFFHTFNTLYDEKRQIVLTSDRPPRELDRLEERLRTRFEWGLAVDVKPPDFETRVAIVLNKGQRMGVSLPRDVAEYIAQTVTANVRQLEGTVNQIMAHRDLMNAPVNMDVAQRAIEVMIRENPGLNPTPSLIIKEICSFYGVDERQLSGKSRVKELVEARQVAMYLIRDIIGMPLEQIGEKIFDRDHSTVIHAVRRVEARLGADAAFDNNVKRIVENIRGI